MSKPKKPSKAMLFASIIYRDTAVLDSASKRLMSEYGALAWKTDELSFDKTDYYATEMGAELKRVFIFFEKLIERDEISEIKKKTNSIEKDLLKGNSRTANIDPGLLTLENVVLATGKNFSHRIYIKDGIFAEITLINKGGGFRALEWTFPDYASPEIIKIFNDVREKYKKSTWGIYTPLP